MAGFDKPALDPTLFQQSGQADRVKSDLTRAAKTRNEAAVDKSAQEFEAMFLAQMLQPMFEGLGSDGYFGGGPGEKAYRGMLVEEYGKAIARAGGVGIAEKVKAEMIKLQEVE